MAGRHFGGLSSSPVLRAGLGVASQGTLARGGCRPLGLRGLHSVCAPAIEPWVVFGINVYLMKARVAP